MIQSFCGSPEGIFGFLFIILIFSTPVAIFVVITNILLKDTEFYKKRVFNGFRKILYFTILILIALLLYMIFTIGF